MYQLWPEQATAVIKNETPLVLVGDYIDPLAVRSWLSLKRTSKRVSLVLHVQNTDERRTDYEPCA